MGNLTEVVPQVVVDGSTQTVGLPSLSNPRVYRSVYTCDYWCDFMRDFFLLIDVNECISQGLPVRAIIHGSIRNCTLVLIYQKEKVAINLRHKSHVYTGLMVIVTYTSNLTTLIRS